MNELQHPKLFKLILKSTKELFFSFIQSVVQFLRFNPQKNIKQMD